MRKTLSVLLALLMVLSIMPLAAGAEAAPSGQIVVGSTTELSGDFFTTLWGNNAMDNAYKQSVHGYLTAPYTKENGFQINPTVVEEYTPQENEDGSKTYTFKIAEDLVFNDETPITAKDFVLYWLLATSKEIADLGGVTADGAEVVGYEAYHAGETNVFEGVRLIDDYTFSITLAAEFVPYFYELALVSSTAYPMHIIVPGCDIADDGEGIYFTGDYSKELVEKTILDPQDGYRFKPLVSAGPYSFVEYNKESRSGTMKANPLYKGDYNGQKPQIETIITKYVVAATMLSELEAGQVDLLSQVTDGAEIVNGLELVDNGNVEYNTYLRNGFGYFSFACEPGTPTHYPEVRRAIAYCIDVPEFARQFTQGFGQVVYGYYGAAQWMAQQNKDELSETMNTYALSLENAKAELEAGGWTLNENGDPFVEGTDTLRYKDIDGELMPCKIMWASSVDNQVSDLINQMLPENMRAVGMEIEKSEMQFAELYNYYNQPNTPALPDGRNGYGMFNLATNFTAVFDPRYTYHTDAKYLGGNNNVSGLQDQELTDLAMQMLNLNGDQSEEYSATWLQWQQRWNELIPMVPLYSNEYFDFYNPKLKNFDADSVWSWYWAMLYATVEE